MRNLKFSLLALLMGAGVVFFSACTGGDEDDINPAPVIELIGGSEYVSGDQSIETGTAFTVGINITSTVKLSKLEITRNIGGTVNIPAGCGPCDSTLSAKELRTDVNFMTGDNEGTEIYTITATDKDGGSSSKTITLTVTEAGNALDEITAEDNGGDPLRIYNFQGLKQGAFDLVVGQPLSSGDPNGDKDLQDSTTSGEIASWPGRWTSRNGGTFKVVDNSTYGWTNLNTDKAVKAAWDASGSAEMTISPAKGDIIVFNVRGGDVYHMIEILDVVSTDNNNDDYIEFQYKRPF